VQQYLSAADFILYTMVFLGAYFVGARNESGSRTVVGNGDGSEAYLELTVAVSQEYYCAIFMASLHLQFLFRFFFSLSSSLPLFMPSTPISHTRQEIA
jgi:hypothetical protein